MRSNSVFNNIMPSSSNHSISIPISFDRFRGKSIQFLSPFRNYHYNKRNKQSPERSWVRKTQVHPAEHKSTESDRIGHDVTNLFHANKSPNSKTISFSKTAQNKKCSKFDTRPTSNVIGVLDIRKLPVTNPSQPAITGHKCPPTPCMIGYRHSSLPNLVPTRIIKRPKTFDDSIKQFDVEHFNA